MGRYIDPRGKLLAHPERLAGWMRGDTPAPVTLEWDLSNRCTLGCDACHFAHTHTRGPLARREKPVWSGPVGDLADWDVVVRALKDAAQMGVQGVVWTGGGEPTTHPHWRDIIAAADAYGLAQGLYTHGALLRDDDRRALRPLTWAVVSLDADDEASYVAYKGVDQFQAACDGLQHLTVAGVTTGASFLLSDQNWYRAPSMLALARGLGATYTTFRPLIETATADPSHLVGDRAWVSDARALLAELAQQPDVEIDSMRFEDFRGWTGDRGYAACYGVRFTCTVTPDARVWVCPNRRGMAQSCLGDLRLESFPTIWAKHTGQWTDFASCRALCRLHYVNQTAAQVFAPRVHTEFV